VHVELDVEALALHNLNTMLHWQHCTTCCAKCPTQTLSTQYLILSYRNKSFLTSFVSFTSTVWGLNAFRTHSEGFGNCPNPELNQRSGSGQHPNLNPKKVFSSVRFRFELWFRTKPSHHYALGQLSGSLTLQHTRCTMMPRTIWKLQQK
jgi:hypothetical protein